MKQSLMKDIRLVGRIAILLLLSVSGSVQGVDNQELDCELPPINFESQRIDVLGDYEKTQVCKLSRPESLCARVGPADNACRTIARAVGGVRNVSCAYPNTCAFLVKSPVQHPSRPGFAYVSLCTPKFIGVIFPCRENSLVIANPFYRGVYVNDDPPPDVDPGRTIEPGNIASNPHCEFPRLDIDALPADVLGDREKVNICSLPRPMYLCPRGKGEADEFCRKIARSVGGTSDPKCLRRNTCTFHVKKPVQHPSTPGEAYVSLCVPDGAGVISPCRENNLVVIDPFYEPIDDTLIDPDEPPTEDAPNWIPLQGLSRCGQVDEAVVNFNVSSKKITQPQKTIRGQFPWQVALYRKGYSDSEIQYQQFCGASIISQQHLLTAAHCFSDIDFNFRAVIGDFDRLEAEPGEQLFLFGSNEVYAHEEYNSITEENDVAIVKLKGTITLGMYAQPICLPARTLPYKDKLDCIISGWGKTVSSHADYSRKLQAARVATLAQNDCRKEESYGNRIKDTMFCAGSFLGGADSCQGDSGGPIVCDIQDEYNKHYLIQLGVVSFGTGCGRALKPGVYTRLTMYQEWMDKTIQDSIKNIGPLVQKKVGSYRKPGS